MYSSALVPPGTHICFDIKLESWAFLGFIGNQAYLKLGYLKEKNVIFWGGNLKGLGLFSFRYR
jgi:hypothetical protein